MLFIGKFVIYSVHAVVLLDNVFYQRTKLLLDTKLKLESG